jgi:hypothetical protein
MDRKLVSYFGISLVMILLAGVPATFSQEISQEALKKEGVSMEELGTMTTYYYKNPQPAKMLSVLKAILTQEDLVKNSSHFYPIAHLFAAIAHNDESFLANLKKLEPELTGTQKEGIQLIIKDAVSFVSPEPTTPASLDALWAEFIATGDTAPVKKIIAVLGVPNTGMGMLLIGAAEWSLASNAQQHELVMAVIQEEAKTARGPIKERLTKILGEAERQSTVNSPQTTGGNLQPADGSK